jgi:glutaredoxin
VPGTKLRPDSRFAYSFSRIPAAIRLPATTAAARLKYCRWMHEVPVTRPLHPTRRRAGLGASLLVASLALAALPAAAQYKLVAPDGSVTYTDRPPADASAKVSSLGRPNVVEAAPQDALPPDLRQAAARFPVTLYSTADCPPCESARQLLQQRGIPFTEKLIVSEDDAIAMERLLGQRAVPSLTIGAQALRGLSPTEWGAYLDLAGYPRESRLPKGWQPPAAAPLAQRTTARAATPPPTAEPARSAPPPAAPAAPAPGTIRF